MSKEKTRLRISRQGTGLAKIDGDSVQSFWWNLSLAEKRYILRFEDPELVECLFSIWQRLCISDMTCYVVGIGSQDGASKKAGNEFFAIEGFISQSAVLHEAAFYAKLELADNEDFFEIVEKWMDGPLWAGRTILHRRDWPSLFKASVNSWSDLVRQIFKLVESALYHAEQASRLNSTAGLSSAKEASPSKNSKRRARKKQTSIKLKAEADLCPVCDGTGILLDDPCPLCVSDAEDAAPAEEVLEDEEENDASEADEVEDPEHEEKALCSDEQEVDAKDEQEEEETTNVTQSDDEKEEDTSRASKDGENDEEDEEWEAEVLDRKFGVEMEEGHDDITQLQCDHFEYEEHEDTTTGWRTKSRKKKKLLSRASRNLIATWSSGWRSIGRRCEAVGGQLVLFERPMSQSAGVPNKVLGERAKAARVVRATVKNTFVHLLPDAPVKQGLSRSISLPSL